MVYFGTVHPNDAARLVRGLTQSRNHHDQHYCVGSAYGRDVIFVQRAMTIHSAYRTPETYVWNIIAVDMIDATRFPNIYLEGRHRHGIAFRESVSMPRRDWVEVPEQMLFNYDALFRSTYLIHMPTAFSSFFPTYIKPDLAAQIGHYFGMFDYEIFEDTLYVYYLAKRPSLEKLDHMLKAGAWLASELETK